MLIYLSAAAYILMFVIFCKPCTPQSGFSVITFICVLVFAALILCARIYVEADRLGRAKLCLSFICVLVFTILPVATHDCVNPARQQTILCDIPNYFIKYYWQIYVQRTYLLPPKT